jgi:hypothetical protein
MSVPSSTPSYKDIVLQLKSQYSGGNMYVGRFLLINAGESIVNSGFMGSETVVSLGSNDSIKSEAPACIAAPLVTMVAKNAIDLGVLGQRELRVPVRLYSPEQLIITTNHFSIGDLSFLVEPKKAYISCKKLTLIKSTDEEPSVFEKVKSFLMSDDCEIEVMRRS